MSIRTKPDNKRGGKNVKKKRKKKNKEEKKYRNIVKSFSREQFSDFSLENRRIGFADMFKHL